VSGVHTIELNCIQRSDTAKYKSRTRAFVSRNTKARNIKLARSWYCHDGNVFK